jgi:hypothetical protein
VIDPIEKFLYIKINAPAVAPGDILHCLMSRPSWSEPVAVFGERPVPTASAEPAAPPAG